MYKLTFQDHSTFGIQIVVEGRIKIIITAVLQEIHIPTMITNYFKI